MNDDLISRKALKKALDWIINNPYVDLDREIMEENDNADVLKAYYLGYSQAKVDFEQEERPKGRLIIKNHMETCEKCGSVMPMMNDYYRAKLRGCPYCLTEFTNLADMRKEKEE